MKKARRRATNAWTLSGASISGGASEYEESAKFRSNTVWTFLG
jgi:hypothetical protein